MLKVGKTPKIIKSNYYPTTAVSPLNHVPKCHTHMFSEHFQGW